MMRKVFLLASFFLACVSVFSKSAIGEWQTHFSYKMANQVVLADDKLYVEASGKLFSYQISDESLETFTTLDGLNGHTVSFIGWCSQQKTLIIVYSDGNIDLLTTTGLVNLPDFKNKSMTADKTIYGLRVFGNEAFLSTGVGLLILNVAKKEFGDSYYMGISTSTYTQCVDATQWGDSLMVATSSGLFAGDRTDNLQDDTYWKPVSFVAGNSVKKIVRFGELFYALTSVGTIYSGNPGNWSMFLSDAGITELSVQNDALFACSGTTTYMFDRSIIRQSVDPMLDYSVAWDSENQKLYMASGTFGLSILKYNGTSYTFEKDSIFPDGPVQNTSWNAFFKDGVYYATAGGRWGNRYFIEGDVLIYEDEQWSGLKDKSAMWNSMGYRSQDFINMAIDPEDKTHFFVTTWGDGLLEFKKNLFYKCHNSENSPLKTILPGRYCRVDGAIYDSEGNLWLLNSHYNPFAPAATRDLPDSSLLILKKDGTWFHPFYSKLKTSPTWNSILFTSNGQTWMNSARYTFGIFVLDNKGTLTDTTDDVTKYFNNFTDQDGELLSPWAICSMVEDKNGTIWLGTNVGPILASGISNIFKDSYTFTRIKIPRNDGTDIADYLLKDIRINCMAVDGANRKWIGTEGYGVYLLSSDGLTEIHHFSTENSPLPSDYIWSLALNPETGETFIGTPAGLVSYRSDATEGSDNYQNIHVFPNPVRPEYSGQITVAGLMEKSQVRITDLSGNAVVSGTSQGGFFVWNGNLKNGKKAASGVYLVFCASEDGTDYQACKFMIVR
jgi:hypothetical protein